MAFDPVTKQRKGSMEPENTTSFPPARVLGLAEIELRFVYHSPNEATRELHNEIRRRTLAFASEMNVLLAPATPSREASLFFTAMEEASFWAHAHVARNVGRE